MQSQSRCFSLFLATNLLVMLGGCDACKPKAEAAPNKQIGSSSTPSGPQEIDFGRHAPIKFDAVKAEARAPISFNTESDMQIRLKSGGTVIISESDLITGEPNFQKRGLQFMALDTLELRKGARIVTGGNDLVIFANKIISEDGSIVAFTDKTAKAANAVDAGGAGSPGVSGGSVTLFAINGVDGRLHINLSGQTGGDGATGAAGRNGQSGAKGEDASWGAFGCNHGGGGGLVGQPGDQGATGGSAGNGGHGGTLQFYNVGDQPIPAADLEFAALPGKAGSSGEGGKGGQGGSGGDGGNGGGPCSGGPHGAPGANGKTGANGSPGVDGSKGQQLVKNMNLEVLMKTVKEIPLNEGH